MNSDMYDISICVMSLVLLGMAIAIWVKQTKHEKFSFDSSGCYPCPDCAGAKKILASKKCNSTECRRYPNSGNCISCKQAQEVINCQCCE